MATTALAGRVARLEHQAFNQEMSVLRDEYHRLVQTQESVLPVINAIIHRCIDRGLFAPLPEWCYRLSEEMMTPEQLAYGQQRMRDMVPLLKPWINGKGML